MKKRGSGYRKKIMLIFAYIIKIKATFINLINSYVMKKIFVSLAVLFACAATAFAQPAQGDFMVKGRMALDVAGNTPYQSVGSKTSDAYNLILLTPKVEYFISDMVSVGASVGYGNAWKRTKDVNANIGTSVNRDGVSLFYIGPNVNMYFKLAEKFYVSLDCFIGYVNLASRSMYKLEGNKEVGSSGANFGMLSVAPTINYFITDGWVMTASLGNVSAAIGSTGRTDSSTYYLGANFGTIMLGVGYKF